LTVPNGWRQTKTAAPVIQIQATNGRAVVLVRSAQKEDYRDLKSFAQTGSQRFMKKLTNAEPKSEDVQVNGKPAIRVSAVGTQANGVRRGYVLTFVDTDTMFVEVVCIASASAFKTEQATLVDMANRVKILGAAGPAPSAQLPTPSTAADTPPGRQPPKGRQPR
jgi:negative regulator of genetic competence, sporulation and motility